MKNYQKPRLILWDELESLNQSQEQDQEIPVIFNFQKTDQDEDIESLIERYTIREKLR